ncbi:MAG TPA: TlpA family protein disulfide reductase [Candidatus Omnitrophica bacterium]|nr:TlpA family protein disulfide reductase [Candidatus Omnitrophota bacterium]
MVKFKFFILIVIASFLFGVCVNGEEQSPQIQQKAADFKLEDIKGEKVILSHILKNKNAVLVFWATWCPHCKSEVPKIEKFYKENKDKVAVIGINVRESKAKVENFIKKEGISYTIAMDSDGSVAKSYNVRGVPTIVAVDRDGKNLYYGHSIEEMVEKTEGKL